MDTAPAASVWFETCRSIGMYVVGDRRTWPQRRECA